MLFKALLNKSATYRLYLNPITAGFPSPAEDEIEKELDLNDLLIKRPEATFFLRVSGDSMVKAGIHHQDILIVDRSLEPSHGKVVIASINGELTVKRLIRKDGKVFLAAENEAYPLIEISKDADLRIWGVVTNVIHPL
jgi:DNA polymerase V